MTFISYHGYAPCREYEPYVSLHINPRLNSFLGKCKQLFPTWSTWVWYEIVKGLIELLQLGSVKPWSKKNCFTSTVPRILPSTKWPWLENCPIMLWYPIQLPFGGFQRGLIPSLWYHLVVNSFQQISSSARASPQMVGSEEMKEFRNFLFPSLINSHQPT